MEDQNAVDVVLAALIHPDVFGQKLGRTVQQVLGVSWKAIVRAIKCRQAIEKVVFETNSHCFSPSCWSTIQK